MAGELEILLQAGNRPRRALPRAHELFGDPRDTPLFSNMAAVCEHSARRRELAWPMSVLLPATQPDDPDFAGLVALYCNHLGHVLAPEPPPAAEAAATWAGWLVTLELAARAYADSLPAGHDVGNYLDRVRNALVRSMHAARPQDEAFWQTAASAAAGRIDAIIHPATAELRSLRDDAAAYFRSLPFLEAAPPAGEPALAYRRGRRLICGLITGIV